MICSQILVAVAATIKLELALYFSTDYFPPYLDTRSDKLCPTGGDVTKLCAASSEIS